MAPETEGLQPLVPRPGSSARGARLARLRDDPRAGAVLLAVVALVAGWLWYRAGLNGAAMANPTASSTTIVVPATTNPGAGAATGDGADAAAGSGAGPGAGIAPGQSATGSTGPSSAPASLVVHVAGGVVHPGVYRLPPGARVEDAITAAGGPVPGVDIDAVNRAAPLADGQRVRVPLPGEPPPPPEPEPVPLPSGTVPTTAARGPINLNTASAQDLETLPGVGPAIAAAIVEQRTRRGGFTSVRDLLDVRGIGESRLAQLEALVTV